MKIISMSSCGSSAILLSDLITRKQFCTSLEENSFIWNFIHFQTFTMASQPMDMSGSGAGGVGAVGAAVGHQGGGFIPMSVAHGSGSRTMSPK